MNHRASKPGPPVGLTMGDGAGIGPEILLAALRHPTLAQNTIIYGTASVFQKTRQQLAAAQPSCPWPKLHTIALDAWRRQRGDVKRPPDGHVTLIDVSERLPAQARQTLQPLPSIPFGAHLPAFGHLQGVALEVAIEDAKNGFISSICTAPLNKALFKAAGLPPTGHTEILAARTQASRHVMMLAGERLRVSLVTTHLPLKDVSAHLSAARIVDVIQTTGEDLKRLWGIQEPRMAIAALNPHAGEGGTMGDEEITTIVPAIHAARDAGWDVSGPWPADTLMASAAPGRQWDYDAVICMYHDQALIPLKLLHFGQSANITLGLPLIRTSVDHGTAYDIAGQGIADEGSMRYAIELAMDFAARTNG